MSYTRLPGIQHLAKVIRSTAEETERVLHENDGDHPPVSYRKTWSVAYALHRGEMSLKSALQACDTLKPHLNVRCNKEVVNIVWKSAQGVQYFCRPLKERLYYIRSDLAIPVNPRFYLVKDRRPYIFWLQPWKRFELSTEQLGVLASVIRHTFVVDDFEGAELHLLDTSADKGDEVRSPKLLGFHDLPLLSDQELKDATDRFAVAFDAFAASRKPKPQREERRPRDNQTDFFND